jgi:hypothetical protein
MKAKMLLLLITLGLGTLMVVAAQLLPEYHDALFTALPVLALVFGIVLIILESKKKARAKDVPDKSR